MANLKNFKAYQNKEGYYDSDEEQIRIDIILDMIGQNKKVLDLGSYNGCILKKIVAQNNDVIGLEGSEKLVKQLSNDGLNVKKANLEKDFPFTSKTFDTVFAGEIIEHIINTDNFLREIYRVLKPNGCLVLTTPNAAALDRRLMLLFNKNPFFEASFSYPKTSAGHLRFFNNKLLFGFLKSHDFCVIDYKTEFVPFCSGLNSRFIGKIFPSLGYSIIVKCKKQKIKND